MNENNYYAFAENDYNFIMDNYSRGGVWNSMCSLSQKVCERLLKHLISVYYTPNSDAEVSAVNDVMRAHSLTKIERFLKDYVDIQLDTQTHNAIREVNGFYFETSYPGDESYFVNGDDIEVAVSAMKACKDFVDQFLIQHDINSGGIAD